MAGPGTVAEGRQRVVRGQVGLPVRIGASARTRARQNVASEWVLWHLQVFESYAYGRVLVLDGAIQLTQRDEFAYQACVAEREDSAQASRAARA